MGTSSTTAKRACSHLHASLRLTIRIGHKPFGQQRSCCHGSFTKVSKIAMQIAEQQSYCLFNDPHGWWEERLESSALPKYPPFQGSKYPPELLLWSGYKRSLNWIDSLAGDLVKRKNNINSLQIVTENNSLTFGQLRS